MKNDNYSFNEQSKIHSSFLILHFSFFILLFFILLFFILHLSVALILHFVYLCIYLHKKFGLFKKNAYLCSAFVKMAHKGVHFVWCEPHHKREIINVRSEYS